VARVVLENVCKAFGDVKAVTCFYLEVEDKEFLVLLGPSGCGKSTTLHMVAGLEELSDGRIYIGDKVVTDMPPKDRDIAMVFQDYALYPHMSVRQNMAFGLKLRKFPKDEIERRVSEAAEILGIQELLHRKPRELSGGQRQRVALGRAIVRKPSVFLFDEPLSNLDAKLRAQMRAELINLHKRLQTTIIYVTHDQVEAMTMGTKIVVMKDGEIQQVGRPLEIYHRPINKFVAGFIGSPTMNFFPSKIAAANLDLVIDAGCFQVPIPHVRRSDFENRIAEDVIFGLRPADIHSAQFMKETFDNAFAVSGTVEVSEPLGSETLLVIKCAESNFSARVDPRVEIEIGKRIELLFDMDKMHVFEAQPPHQRIGT
jgi:multiple sugar transport system ATP-binding protein